MELIIDQPFMDSETALTTMADTGRRAGPGGAGRVLVLAQAARETILKSWSGHTHWLREKRQAGLFPSQQHLGTGLAEAGDNYWD